MPSVLTNDYVSRALDIIEDRILLHRSTMANTIPMPLGQSWKIGVKVRLQSLKHQAAAIRPVDRTRQPWIFSNISRLSCHLREGANLYASVYIVQRSRITCEHWFCRSLQFGHCKTVWVQRKWKKSSLFAAQWNSRLMPRQERPHQWPAWSLREVTEIHIRWKR